MIPRGISIAAIPSVRPQVFDAAVEEVEKLMGPSVEHDGGPTDEYLAGLAENHPLAKLGTFRLMMALFRDGMQLLLLAAKNPDAKKHPHWHFHRQRNAEQREILEALLWLITPGLGHLYSFDSLTDALGLDGERVRSNAYTKLRMTPKEIGAFIRAETPRVLTVVPGRKRKKNGSRP